MALRFQSLAFHKYSKTDLPHINFIADFCCVLSFARKKTNTIFTMKIYSLNTHVENYRYLIVSAVLVVLATIALLLRLWTRRTRKTKLWVDDYTLIADLACLYCLFGIQVAGMLFNVPS